MHVDSHTCKAFCKTDRNTLVSNTTGSYERTLLHDAHLDSHHSFGQKTTSNSHNFLTETISPHTIPLHIKVSTISKVANMLRTCCRNCCHCLIRGSSGGAGVMACDGGSGSSSSGGSGGGSGAILFLAVVVFLLLFTCPFCWHRPSPFRCPVLFPQAAACPPSTHNG